LDFYQSDRSIDVILARALIRKIRGDRHPLISILCFFFH